MSEPGDGTDGDETDGDTIDGRDGSGEAGDHDEYVDELPEDLNLSEFVGPHTFPNNNRRRIPAAIYLLMGAACIALWITRGDSSPLVNVGTLWAGIGLVVFALYGMVAGRTLAVEESDALVTATAKVGFPVGHAAAQMAWRGWLSPSDVAHPAVLRREPAGDPGHRARRRDRRAGRGVVRRGQPRGLVRVRPRRHGHLLELTDRPQATRPLATVARGPGTGRHRRRRADQSHVAQVLHTVRPTEYSLLTGVSTVADVAGGLRIHF